MHVFAGSAAEGGEDLDEGRRRFEIESGIANALLEQ